MKTKTTTNVKTIYFTLISIFLLIKVGYGQTIVQTKSSFGNEGCGTIITQQQINYLDKTRKQRQNYQIQRFAKMNIVQVPIQCHVVRTDLGTGGLTPSEILDAINTMNSYYVNVNIEFYQISPINYIDNSNYFDFEINQEADVCDPNDVPNVINIYFFNTVTQGGFDYCGYAYLPPSVDRIVMKNSCAMNGSTLTHEMGHYFALYHTHGKSNFIKTDELVDGSNCTVAGDDVCDTPADPKLSGLVDDVSCLYLGAETDDNGDLYSPDPTNIMSYSKKHCRTTLTAGQYNRVGYSLAFDRNYLVGNVGGTCPAFTNAPYQESFEGGLGDWIQDADDDMDWVNHTGQTATASTGPTAAVDGQYYMYIESSHPNHPNKTAGLISPCIDLGFDSELSFQYHMYGSGTGGLSVDVSTDYGLTWVPLWLISGDQGNIWHAQTVDLSAFTNDIVKFRITANTTNSELGDIAIDKVQINGSGPTTAIPDPNFEQALIDLGYEIGTPDGSVPTAHISSVTFLDVANKNIADLTGIQDFTDLLYLDCYDNQLSSLDLSNNQALINLDCSHNQLTSLDVSQNNFLSILDCSHNQLTSLDLSQNPFLYELRCRNNQLTSLDLSGATFLTELYCRDNLLTSLNVNTNAVLEELNCSDNELTSLNVSQNSALVKLVCDNNQLFSLDLRNGNNQNLTDFFCWINPDLTCINVDDVSWANANWTMGIPFNTVFSTNCPGTYCQSYATQAWFYIDSIGLGGINNKSGDDGGYGDYTHLSTPIADGMLISVVPGSQFAPPVQVLFTNVWIDFNQDGDFDDNGELIIQKEQKMFLRGDANNDGQVNVSDMIYIYNFLFQGTGALVNPDAADVNDDGVINITDGVYLANFLFAGTVSALPQPFPTIGMDPTADNLGNDVFGTINIPAGANLGATIMRIQTKLGGFASSGCEVFTYGEVEDYTVEIVSSNKMIAGDDENILEENENNWVVKTFPNPSNGIINIKVEASTDEDFTFKVMNLRGQVVHEGMGSDGLGARIDLADQPKGIYFIQVVAGTKAMTRKVVIQ
ncbi:MAG TPA: T9SS type A sorting domain-containing protein [Flavobacteriales bacterium]|nr:T9SS type A sorting domain-containing protein [Flavobacteriales bacterium]HIO67057.1 T9SS type A sorting domain-containing protein [Flavobacteriales bacterium]